MLSVLNKDVRARSEKKDGAARERKRYVMLPSEDGGPRVEISGVAII